jgi:hypothetical protein
VADILTADEGIGTPQMGGAQTGAANALAASQARKSSKYEEFFAAKAKNLVKGAGQVTLGGDRGSTGYPLQEGTHGTEIMARQFDTITKSRAVSLDGYNDTDEVVGGISSEFWGHPRAGAMKFMAQRDSMVRKNFTATNLGLSGTPYGLVPSIGGFAE